MNDLNLDKLRVQRDATGGLKVKLARRRPRWHWALLAAAIAVVVWLLLPSSAALQTSQVVSAWPSQQYELLNATGYVVARRKTAVSSKGTGRVEWIGPSEGDHVKEGDVVARLESHDVAASYRAAVANTAVAAAGVATARSEFDDANTNLGRMQLLFSKKLVSLLNLQDGRSRVARAKAALESAQASLAAARANEEYAHSNLDYTQIRAPFDGTVIARSANLGDIITPLSSAADAKGAVLVLADMSTLEVDADVSESALSQLKTGQPCEIALDAFPERRFRGEVSVVVPAVNRSSATVTTKVRILDADGSILPDMSARVSFLSQGLGGTAQSQPVLAVNPAAIVQRDGHDVVYVVADGGRAREVAVNTGATLGAVREISGTLKSGDTVVLAPGHGVRDGSRLKLAAER
ncbi:efflux RND transporter periplasmic adaptor subunit [Solimonas soli]|uniref:efflux RND transporter periplasmic adaptor subunit n=1 Tax=Solimonas soli TaxID=413479 RepID=UPI000485DB0E|nr:efflux RND transporter periplasmic adaptor subunit [Solimonas soli]